MPNAMGQGKVEGCTVNAGLAAGNDGQLREVKHGECPAWLALLCPIEQGVAGLRRRPLAGYLVLEDRQGFGHGLAVLVRQALRRFLPRGKFFRGQLFGAHGLFLLNVPGFDLIWAGENFVDVLASRHVVAPIS